MGLFGKKKKADDVADVDAPAVEAAEDDATSTKDKKGKKDKKDKRAKSVDTNTPDPRKARRFFEYAQTTADARNFDYAIVCWINGMKHDPESMDAHEKLREVAMRRLVQGGKPAGRKEMANCPSGKSLAEKMLAAEFQWAHDPLDASKAANTMDAAAKAELNEVAYWAAGLVLESNDAQEKPDAKIYDRVKTVGLSMKAWDRAVEAQKRLCMMDPENMAKRQELKQLEAEATVTRGAYSEASSFRDSIKDAEGQKALEAADAISGTDAQMQEKIARAREEFEEDPDNVDRMEKLVRALLAQQNEKGENEAIEVLKGAYERSGTYRQKMEIGNIRMRQFKRILNGIKKKAENASGEAKQQLAIEYKVVMKKQLAFELKEFADRAKNYPTQMELRYQLGQRQLRAGQVDEAIASFQEAKADPKHRLQSLRFLGEAFVKKGWFDEAIDTFEGALAAHHSKDDRFGLDMQYLLMLGKEQVARRDKDANAADDAVRIASTIAQTKFDFKDVRQRMPGLRELAKKLRG